MEGTYVLPEAQVDRFFCNVMIPFPPAHVLDAVLQQTTGKEVLEPARVLAPEDILQLQAFTREVPVSAPVREAVVRLILASQPDSPTASPQVKRFVQLGISPRGAQALLLAGKARALLQGRFNVGFEDLVAVALPTLRHRVQLNFEGEAENVMIEEVLLQLVQQNLADSKA
jgi:MoxR-like ATPase